MVLFDILKFNYLSFLINPYFHTFQLACLFGFIANLCLRGGRGFGINGDSCSTGKLTLYNLGIVKIEMLTAVYPLYPR